MAALVNLSVSVPALAGISIQPQVGFHGVFQLGRPFPLEIELNNNGRPTEGTLDVQVWKGGATKGGTPYPVKYRRELFLPAQSQKSVQFTVDPDFISRPLLITFSSANTRVTREVDLRRHFSPTAVLLLISENNALPPLSLSTSVQNRLVSITLNELAADPRALLGVSHLILYDQSLRDLSRAQLSAIDNWLSSGGRLIILGSINYALYQETALSRFLPVRVAGARRITFTPPGERNRSLEHIRDAWVQESTVVQGEAALKAEGLPLIVEANRGRGTVVYLALDIGRPPLSQWDGLAKFIQNLLAPAALDEPPPRSEWNEPVFSQLISSPSFIATYVPSGSLFVAMIGYLAGIGVIAWLWQRKGWPARKLSGVFLSFVTLAAVAGYVQFSRGGNIPDGVLLSSTIMESSGDGFVDAQANLALFSTQVRDYNLQLEPGWMDLTPVSNRAKGADAAVMREDGGGMSRFQLPLREWDYRLFRLRFVDRFPMRAEFEVQRDKLLLKVDNRSAKDLTDCWLLLPGQRFSLGPIPRGASWTKVFPLAEPKPLGDSVRADSVSFREITFPEKTRDVLFHSSFFSSEQDPNWASGTGVFFGWVKDPEPRVRTDDTKIQLQDYALYRKLIPLARGDEE
ncbi:MAG TPA: hypothetical protein VMT22_22510 [Terriglobales bacterium]|nr:hypothetical protein [Terriglobales bacterium]